MNLQVALSGRHTEFILGNDGAPVGHKAFDHRGRRQMIHYQMRWINPRKTLDGGKIQASISALPARRPSSAGADTGLHPVCNAIFLRMHSGYVPVRKTVQLRRADSRDAAVARKP